MSDDPFIGRVIGDYQVMSRLGEGGMGLVYKGQHSALGQVVAIKSLHSALMNNQSARERFVREAQALARLNHPNIISLLNFINNDAGCFIVMEFAEGEDVEHKLQRMGLIPPEQCIPWFIEILRALAFAHAQGIIHRDIKPSNILFGMAGNTRVVKLCDFGIAKVSADDAPGRADTIAGAGLPVRLFSPAWAAPEQLVGGAIGPPTDVYALGLVTAYMLLGRPVFAIGSGDDFAEARHDSERAIRWTLDAAGLAPGLVELLVAACRDVQADRLAAVDDLADGLRQLVEDEAPAPRARLVPVMMPLPAPEPEPRLRTAEGTPAPMPTMTRATPVATPVAARATLSIDPTGDAEVVVAGRRLRLVAMAGDTLDLGGDGPHVRSPARFRVTVLPSAGAAPRLNLRGLNCFVARAGARPSTAVDVDADVELHLIAPDRRGLDEVRCTVGRAGPAGCLYDLGAVDLAVPAAAGIALFDLGPGRELVLLHRAAHASVPRRATRNPRP